MSATESLITEHPADPEGASVSVAADLLIGTSEQAEDLHVHGEARIAGRLAVGEYLQLQSSAPPADSDGSDSADSARAGALRYTGSDFQAYDGSVWRSLTRGSTADSRLSGSVVQGANNSPAGLLSTLWGDSNTGSGWAATAWGWGNTGSGSKSTAWGTGNVATAEGSTAWGYRSSVSGIHATAWGAQNTSSGWVASVWGWGNTGSGSKSTAWGTGNVATAEGSTVWGLENLSRSYLSTVMGRYNLGHGSSSNWQPNDSLLEVGMGTGKAARANALTLLKNGHLTVGPHSSLPAAPGEEALRVHGALRVGASTGSSPGAGTIRYNDLLADFEGFDGTRWKSLTSISRIEATGDIPMFGQ